MVIYMLQHYIIVIVTTQSNLFKIKGGIHSSNSIKSISFVTMLKSSIKSKNIKVYLDNNTMITNQPLHFIQLTLLNQKVLTKSNH